MISFQLPLFFHQDPILFIKGFQIALGSWQKDIKEAYDCIMENPNSPLYFKTRRPRGGGGENMWFEKIHILNTKKNAFLFDMLGDSSNVGDLAKRFPAQPVTELTPVFRNLNFKDIIVDSCQTLINAKGLPESPIEDLTFENLVSDNKNISLQDVGTVTFK